MNQKNNERMAQLDVLRIALSLFVIVLHFNNESFGGALRFAEGHAREFTLLTEALTIPAVNLFIMLSGYFLIEKQSRYLVKPFHLFFITMGYGGLIGLVKMLLSKSFSLRALVHCVLPTRYFLWLYCTLYLLSPWINVVLQKITKQQYKLLLLLMFVLFSAWPTIVDIFCGIRGTVINGVSTVSLTNNGAGYTLVNFVFMYVIGGYIRKYAPRISRLKSFAGYFGCVIAIFILMHFTMTAVNYDNVFVTLSAVFLFLLFQTCKFPNGKIIQSLSGITFQVFIIHGHLFVIFEKMNVRQFLSGNLFLAVGGSILAVFVMYVCSAGIALAGQAIFRPLVSLFKKYIPFRYSVEIEDTPTCSKN